ncbi:MULTISPECIES: tetratricopeptide repeat protein [unclassified Haematospirillum]|uniref:tetratricopeptide repeat protein n=1 Tax=unclassified Haematospirillum TaxID=2622088 RepID=UPI00143B2CC5|nr:MULTISPECIES: tetratricopeptide repeat protein [unclassified Haematospirillum]NKD55923.1 tetratricopeptide repeat protein [Haematospirillum sp. H4890]NKD75983.1 tetratricopeptide repeat protein [Haematospirillum sp. H4485]NKD88627.1 tetratricopeptide repeat protein [Haematospirillum sp. 15-248]
MTSLQDSLFQSVVTALEKQRHQEALQYLTTLIDKEPRHIEGRRLFGLLLSGSGQQEQALPWLVGAAQDAPTHPVLGYEAGELLLTLQKPEQAISMLETYLQHHPENAAAHFSLAMALRKTGQTDAAITHYNHVLALDPGSGHAWFNIGNIHHEEGHKEDAIKAWEEALHAAHPCQEALFHLCLGLIDVGRIQEASSLRGTISILMPDHPLCERLDAELAATHGDTVGAIAHLRLYLQKAPDTPEALMRLARLEAKEGNLDGARAQAKTLIRKVGETWQTCALTGEIEAHFGHTTQARLAWKRAAELRPLDWQLWSNALFLSLHDNKTSPEDVFQDHRNFGQFWERQITPLPHHMAAGPKKRLRIGYVSPDFCHHAISLFVEPLFIRHDRSKFEIVGFHIPRRSDETTQRLRKMTDQWYTLPQDPEKAARLIQRHNIDILVDLAGHTAGNILPLFAWKPAPLQVSMIGYPGTTGLTRVDSRPLYGNPPKRTDEQKYSVERLWDQAGPSEINAPKECWCPSPLPMLQRGWPLFGSVNKYLKVDSETRRLWGRILDACPTARLTVIAPGADNPETRKVILHDFAADSCPVDRIDLREEMPLKDWITFCRGIDVVLDPLHYRGGTTIKLLMAMGIKIVHLYEGDNTEEYNNPIHAKDLDDYVRLACGLVSDPEKLARQRLYDQECEKRHGDELQRLFLWIIETEFLRSWEQYLRTAPSNV